MRTILTFGVVLWVAAIGFGLAYLNKYETTPGTRALSPPAVFPSASGIEREETRSTLLFFAHPKCPCSRASINEIAKIMPEVQGRLTVYVVLSKPPGASDDWADTGLRASAEKIPGVRVIVDENETETNVFGVTTSGTALLYDVLGNLRFQGGVTRSRGQEGDNTGRSAIADLVNNNFSEYDETSVYGCEIQGIQDEQATAPTQ